ARVRSPQVVSRSAAVDRVAVTAAAHHVRNAATRTAYPGGCAGGAGQTESHRGAVTAVIDRLRGYVPRDGAARLHVDRAGRVADVRERAPGHTCARPAIRRRI